MTALRYGSLAGVLICSGCSWLGQRGVDLADCFRSVAGVGLGLTVDAQVTDFVSPGIGVASVTRNYGWFDREISGFWIESDVINTPRLAYEALAAEFEHSASDQLDENIALTRLALSSLNLPKERWIRRGGVVQVEHFALFNFFGIGERQRAWWLADVLLEPGDIVMRPEKSTWQRGWIELGATAVFVHARFGINPLEIIDFAAGCVGFDPAEDDRREPFYRLRPFDEDVEKRFWEL